MAHFEDNLDNKSAAGDNKPRVRISLRSNVSHFPQEGGYGDDREFKASGSECASPHNRQTQFTTHSVANSSASYSTLHSRPTRRKSMAKEQQKQLELAAKVKPIPGYVSCSRYVVEHNICVALTTTLTIYALVGDDLRLLTTNLPADNIFNAFTVLCIAIFLFEIVLSCLGKDDYFGGFFFILDAISTATLVLDLTWVSDAIQGDDENVDSLSGSETARLGARTARVVRVLRLVRILKLYKAIYEARARQKKAEEKLREKRPGEDDDDWDEADAGHHDDVKLESMQRGSRVGRRLSDLTTRKVIILVLSMMLFLPLLRVDPADQYAFSPHYAADLVHESFMSWQKAINDALDNYTQAELRKDYVRQVLQLIYYHNWYSGQQDCEDCPGMYYNHVFWVGLVSQQSSTVLVDKAAQARLLPENVAQYETDAVIPQDKDFNFNSLPPIVQNTLGSKWTAECSNKETIFRNGFSLLKDEIPDLVGYAVKCPEDLRKVEREKYTARVITKDEAKEWHFGFYFDKRSYTRQESVFSLILTAFVCFMLTTAAVVFTQDAESMVLNPLEIMISKVERIRDNPLMAMKMSDEEFRQEEIRKQEEQRASKEVSKMQYLKDKVMCTSKQRANEPMETVILEKTIIKIGSLLALGFGEAGANIIEQNMSGSDSAMVTAMIEGESVECIIGCARIQNFSAATEVLGGNVMAFVNRISEIVHGGVDEFHGAANKNNGDQFLIIWRTSDLDDGYSSKLADMSVVAFARILGAVNRSPVLAAYRGHPGLQQKIASDFRVNLTFSLHYGWAIEGAVGSEFKIDASYLSPNVSIAESLEAATTTYRVNILLSEMVLKLCTPEATSKCRLIDRVYVSGETMDLYCIDLDYKTLAVDKEKKKLPAWNPRQRFKVRQFLEAEKASKWSDRVDILEFFNDDADISTMRFRYTLEFTHVFNMGYQNYSEGEWLVAQRFLLLTRNMLGTEDGPSVALLNYMELFHFAAPEWWKGIRNLSFQDQAAAEKSVV